MGEHAETGMVRVLTSNFDRTIELTDSGSGSNALESQHGPRPEACRAIVAVDYLLMREDDEVCYSMVPMLSGLTWELGGPSLRLPRLDLELDAE